MHRLRTVFYVTLLTIVTFLLMIFDHHESPNTLLGFARFAVNFTGVSLCWALHSLYLIVRDSFRQR